MDVFLLAHISARCVKVLMNYYERIGVQKRADEIACIKYCKKKATMRIVDSLA